MARFRGIMMAALLLVIFIADIASLPPELPDPSIWPILSKLCPGGGGGDGDEGGEEAGGGGGGGDAQGGRGCIDPSSAENVCKADALGVSAADLRAAASYLAWLAEGEGCSSGGTSDDERNGKEREGLLHAAVDQVGQGEGFIKAEEGNEGIEELRDAFRIVSPSNGTLYDPNNFRDGELHIWIEVETGGYPIGFPSGGGLLAYFSGDHNDGRSLRPVYNRSFSVGVIDPRRDYPIRVHVEVLDRFGDYTGVSASVYVGVQEGDELGGGGEGGKCSVGVLPVGLTVDQIIMASAPENSQDGVDIVAPPDGCHMTLIPHSQLSVVARVFVGRNLIPKECWSPTGEIEMPCGNMLQMSVGVVSESGDAPEVEVLGMEDVSDINDGSQGDGRPLFLTRDVVSTNVAAGRTHVIVNISAGDRRAEASSTFTIGFRSPTFSMRRPPHWDHADLDSVFDGIHVVSLPRHRERFERVRDQVVGGAGLGEGVDSVMWEAFDASMVGAGAAMTLRVADRMGGTGSGWSPGAVGCAESHYRLLRHIADHGGSRMLVLEDDVVWNQAAGGVQALVQAMSVLPGDAELAFVGHCHARYRDGGRGKWRRGGACCTHAYVVSGQGASMLADLLHPLWAPIDEVMRDVCYSGQLSCYILDVGGGKEGMHEGVFLQTVSKGT